MSCRCQSCGKHNCQLVQTHGNECCQRSDGPSCQRQRNLERLDDKSILASARTDYTGHELEDEGKEVSDNLGAPQAKPN